MIVSNLTFITIETLCSSKPLRASNQEREIASKARIVDRFRSKHWWISACNLPWPSCLTCTFIKGHQDNGWVPGLVHLRLWAVVQSLGPWFTEVHGPGSYDASLRVEWYGLKRKLQVIRCFANWACRRKLGRNRLRVHEMWLWKASLARWFELWRLLDQWPSLRNGSVPRTRAHLWIIWRLLAAG